MSLVVWLPLTKDLRQQGLSSIVPINNGNIIYSSTGGKLGGCYVFDGVDDAITVGNLSTLVTDSFSFACWFYHDDTWSSKNYETLFGGPSGFELEAKNGGTNSPVLKLYNWGGSTCAYELNKWNHVVFTRNTTGTKLYLNGELKLTGTAGTIPSGNYFVGSWKSTTGQNYKGKMNDVRIYDHCLSQMEVKELAKGLVLHYPLNRQGWGQINNIAATKVVNRSCNNFTYNSSTNEWSMSCSTGSGTWGYGIAISDTAIKWATSQTWVISMEVYVPRSITWNCDINNKPDLADVSEYTGNDYDITGQRLVCTNGVMGNKTLQTGWNKIWFSQTAGTTYGLYNYSTNWGVVTTNESTAINIKIKNVKGEIINAGLPIQPTPWCPNSADALATTLNINGTTEYDCSGYGNNGTLWAYDTAGVITYTSDAPKYQISTFIDSDNNTTNTASGTRYIYGNCELTTPQYLTVAFWCKPIAGYGNNTTQGQFSLTNNAIGASAGQDYDTAPMNHRDGYIDICTSSGVHKTVGITFTANEWHHYTIVYDGRYGRVYKDGIATGATLDMGSILSLKDMKGAVIGFSKAGGVWRSNKSYYSDFRIYATALSASDVKSLYQNSAYIDSSGNVYGAIHMEA